MQPQAPQISQFQAAQTKPSLVTQQVESEKAAPSEQPEESDEPEEPPKDWLSPKIYKGTSIS